MKVDVQVMNEYECCGEVQVGQQVYRWWYETGELCFKSEVSEEIRAAVEKEVGDAAEVMESLQQMHDIDLDTKFGNRA